MILFDEETFKVGDGATFCFFTDRHAGTVIEVRRDGKEVVVQRDHAFRTDENGMSDAQSYRYERDENGTTGVFTLRKNGHFIAKGSAMNNGTYLSAGRHEFYDYSF